MQFITDKIYIGNSVDKKNEQDLILLGITVYKLTRGGHIYNNLEDKHEVDIKFPPNHKTEFESKRK